MVKVKVNDLSTTLRHDCSQLRRVPSLLQFVGVVEQLVYIMLVMDCGDDARKLAACCNHCKPSPSNMKHAKSW